jgi:hypothetical protein
VVVSLSFDASSIAPPNMFETMRFTWNMGIPWKGTPTEGLPAVGFREVIEMATLNGAKALGLGDVTGSLTVGKRADVILIRTNDINVAPLANIETTVVQSATPANVDTVLVDGRIVKREGKLVAYDVDKIVRDAKASSLRIRTAAGGVLAPPPSRKQVRTQGSASLAAQRPWRRHACPRKISRANTMRMTSTGPSVIMKLRASRHICAIGISAASPIPP